MKKAGWMIAGIVLALALLAGGIVLGYSGVYRYGSWGMMGGRGMMGGYGMMGGWGLGMLLFWALITGGIVWLVVAVSRGSGQPVNRQAPAGEAPMDILKRRYAAGEINKEQFDEMKKNLIQ